MYFLAADEPERLRLHVMVLLYISLKEIVVRNLQWSCCLSQKILKRFFLSFLSRMLLISHVEFLCKSKLSIDITVVRCSLLKMSCSRQSIRYLSSCESLRLLFIDVPNLQNLARWFLVINRLLQTTNGYSPQTSSESSLFVVNLWVMFIPLSKQ